MTGHEIRRGEVWIVDLGPTIGPETGKPRPCLIIQNDAGNIKSPLTIIAPITGAKHLERRYPFQVFVPSGEGGLNKDSMVLLQQIRTIDKSRIASYIGKLSSSSMAQVDQAIKISLDLKWLFTL